VRPEYVALAVAGDPTALPAEVVQRQDVGTYWLLTARCGEVTLRARLDPESAVPELGKQVWLKVTGAHTCYYGRNDELIDSADRATETHA
jgi:glycerol transport system ATP-binding protein